MKPLVFSPSTLRCVIMLGLTALVAWLLSHDDAEATVLLLAGGPALIERPISRVNLTNGQTSYVLLPRDFVYHALMLRLSGTFTVSGGTTNGTLHDENPMSYLRRIRIEGAGGGQALTIKDLKGPQAYRRAHWHEVSEQNAVPILSAGVQTTTAWSVVIPIFFSIPHRRAPIETKLLTALWPQLFSELRLELQAGDDTDFVNGGDRTETVNAPICDITAIQVLNPIGVAPWRYVEQHLFRDQTSAIATERQFSNQIAVGRIYRDLMFRVTNEVTNARTPVDDTLGDLTLFIGVTRVLRYTDFREYIQRAKDEYAPQSATNPVGLSALGSRDNPIIGYYPLDFMKGGRFEGMLDTTRFAGRGLTIDPRFDIDTASVRQIDVTAGFLAPAPGVRKR
ncbi:MAG TPA: hypothetical protein VGR44_12135 [Methylomirabilota bacterium]|jgi:hypothetical protein|nr:hypothetical protein [Methylomirabilota bacterium]